MNDGFCACGCGGKTALARQTDTQRGWTKGFPIRYIHGHHARKTGDLWRVEDLGYRTPCWVWRLHLDRDGYGHVTVGRTENHVQIRQSAHAFYWEKQHGSVPVGMILDHLCRIPSCVNPDHLEPVTLAENTRRGRAAKLSMDIAEAIREEHSAGKSIASLAKERKVSATAVSDVVRNKTWMPASQPPIAAPPVPQV